MTCKISMHVKSISIGVFRINYNYNCNIYDHNICDFAFI